MPTTDTTLGMMAYTAVYASLPDARASLRFDRRTVVACLCGTIGAARVFTENGTANDSTIEAHLPVSTVPDGALALGQLVEFSTDGTNWKTYRVTARNETAGLIGVTLGDKDGGI